MEKLSTDLTGVSLGFSWLCSIFVLRYTMLQQNLSFFLNKNKQAQEGEKKQLIQLRDILKSSLQTEQKEVRFIIFITVEKYMSI